MVERDEEEHAAILDQYLSALQSKRFSECEKLLQQNPALKEYTGYLDRLHDLAMDETTLRPSHAVQHGITSQVVGAQFGKYRLEAELGRGGMGVVYQAHQSDLQRHVALKMILHGRVASAEQVWRFLEEARAAATIQHPNVVQVYEVGEHAGQHYIAMECLNGTSLERLLRSCQNAQSLPTPDDAVRFMLPLVDAVEYLHRHDIIHRDLKPGNILLQQISKSENASSWSSSFVGKISDFGLAKSLLRDDGQCTASGVIVGTPSYMAPEQAASKKNLTHAVDVYALGAILYELLTGQPPFKAATSLDTLVMVLEREPARPRTLRPVVPAQLEAIVMKCLEKDPERRYRTAAALQADLKRYLAGEPVEAQPLSLWRRFLHWTRREPALASHVGALASFAAIIQTNYHFSGNVELRLHMHVLLLLGIWIALSFVFQALLRRHMRRTWVACAWTATDILIFSLVLMVRGAETGPLIVGYPILVAISGLWFSAAVIWFTTIAAEVAVLTLMPYWHGWEYLRDNPHHPILVLVMISVLGMVMSYQVERVRSLSRFYGSRVNE